MKPDNVSRLWAVLGFVAIAALTVVCYWPGLGGGWLFDDFANMPAIGASGRVDNWPAFWRYITSGTADPTGRPISLLSFLLNANTWPADPRPFLATNIAIHVGNGLLLAWLLRTLALAAAPTDEARANTAAILAAGIWLLHPYFVSTTLYIVQREAMLPATFTLLGLIAWLHARRRFLGGHSVVGLAWMLVGLGLCTLLATLSKANGCLLPALALTIEYAWLRPWQATGSATTVAPHNGAGCQTWYRRAMLLFAWLPAAAVVAYLGKAGVDGLLHGISTIRPWTLGQRLLTEPRVLMDYLSMLWLPKPYTPGLFNDQIVASTSLWAPVTTVLAILVVVALLIAAVALRKLVPAVSVALLFYFVGQSLESTTLSLELYFEHRNYLPAMLMFWPLALWLTGAPIATRPLRMTEGLKGRLRPALRYILAVGVIVLLAAMTWSRASVWGNQQEQSRLWAALNPTSVRAQAYAARLEMAAGRPDLAVQRLRPMQQARSDQLLVMLNLVVAECMTGHVTPATMAATLSILRRTPNPGGNLTVWLRNAIAQSAAPVCPELDARGVQTLLDASAENRSLSESPRYQQLMQSLRGYAALVKGDGTSALRWYDEALRLAPAPGIALQQAAQLGSAGFPKLGLQHLDQFAAHGQPSPRYGLNMASIHAWVLQEQQYWPRQLEFLRQQLQLGVTQKASGSTDHPQPAAAAHGALTVPTGTVAPSTHSA